MDEIDYSIIVPVYKSSRSLIELSKRTEETFAELEGINFELLFVNDSPFHQETVQTLEHLALEFEHVRVIELTQNFGQQPATLCGIEAARGRFVITMDDDLQHDPRDIPRLLARQEHDSVFARLGRKKHSTFKRLTSKIKGFFDYLLIGKPRHLSLSSFRLIRGDIAKMMLTCSTPYPFIPALLFSVTKDAVNVDVEHHERTHGEGNYSLWKMIMVFSNLLINNSSLLLRFSGALGLVTSTITVVAAVLVLWAKLAGGIAVPGYASVVFLLLFFGGLTLFSLGIIGEYLIRLVATAEQRHAWFIRRTLP